MIEKIDPLYPDDEIRPKLEEAIDKINDIIDRINNIEDRFVKAANTLDRIKTKTMRY